MEAIESPNTNKRSSSMDSIFLFVKNFAHINYEDLPQEVVEVTKKEVLDLLGVAIAGFTAPGVQQLLDIVTDWGGKEESRVIYCNQKVPAPDGCPSELYHGSCFRL